jgi:hypothetical protein
MSMIVTCDAIDAYIIARFLLRGDRPMQPGAKPSLRRADPKGFRNPSGLFEWGRRVDQVTVTSEVTVTYISDL